MAKERQSRAGGQEGRMDGTFIEINKHTWFYRDVGDGPVLLYVHGNTGSSAWWERAMELPGYRCVAPDLPNFGRSYPLDGEISIDAYADAVAGFIRALHIGPAVAVGHSLGGSVCMSLAARHPGLLGGLVLVDSSSPKGLVTPETHYPAIELMRSNRQILAQALKAVVPSLSDEAWFSRLVDDASKMAAPAWVGNARALASFDVSSRLGAWKAPALVIWGRLDLIITEAMARETAAALPGGRLEIVENVGHSVMVEDPALFKRLLLTYLAAVAPR